MSAKWLRHGSVVVLLTALLVAGAPSMGQASGQAASSGTASGANNNRDKIAMAIIQPSDWHFGIQKIKELGGRLLWQDQRLGMLSLIAPDDTFSNLQNFPQSIKLFFSKAVRAALDLSQTPVLPDAWNILDMNRRAARVDELQAVADADGSGVTIAIVDSGIDPAMDALRQTSKGERKIVDWVDFTGEGTVPTGNVILTSNRSPESITIAGTRYDLPVDATSQSGEFHYGYWEEARRWLTGRLAGDINRNGSATDRLLVLVGDTTAGGVYDVAWIDTDGDGSLADETGLRIYREGGGVASFGEDGPGFVLADISAAGDQIELGFDVNGHGTLVSQIAAGRMPANAAEFRSGMAPGASLMAIKAVSSNGESTWERIVRGVRYAATHGAQIINVSIGGSPGMSPSDSPETETLRRIAREYGVLIVIAAGNQGPGLSSLNTPGDPEWMLTVGAYAYPDLWKELFGYSVRQEGVPAFSGRGPRPDGKLGVNVVAPGAVAVPLPPWMSRDGQAFIFQGTSAATPHASGYAALLVQVARTSGYAFSAPLILRAIEQGARFLPGVPVSDQGYGLMNVAASASLLRDRRIRAEEWRSYLQEVPAGMGNPVDTAARRLTLEAGAGQAVIVPVLRRHSPASPSVRLDRQRIYMSPNSRRDLLLLYDPILDFGLHTGILQLHEASRDGLLLGIPYTRVVPLRIQAENNGRVGISGRVAAAGIKRSYIEIPEGTTKVRWQISVNRQDGDRQLRWYLYRPDGSLNYGSSWIGGGRPVHEESIEMNNPAPGVWEIVLEGNPDSQQQNSLEAGWSIEAVAAGVQFEPLHVRRGALDAFWSGNLRLQSYGIAGDLRHEAIGFAATPGVISRELIQVSEDKSGFFRITDIQGDTELMHLEFSPGVFSTDNRSGNYRIFLYLENADGSLSEVARSAQAVIPVLEVRTPAPGRYVVWIEGDDLPRKTVDGQLLYGRWDGRQLQVTPALRSRNNGEPWSVWVNAGRLPDDPGRYFASVLLRDAESGRLLSVVPIILSKDQPELQVFIAGTPPGPNLPGTMTVHIQNSETLRPVETYVSINGRIYPVRNGILELNLAVRRNPRTLSVRIDDPRYAYFQEVWQTAEIE